LYESIPEKEALAKLEATIAARLAKEGLGEASYRPYKVEFFAGQWVIRIDLRYGPYTGAQRNRVLQIIGEEEDRFLFEQRGIKRH
jgi:hypothetical protein